MLTKENKVKQGTPPTQEDLDSLPPTGFSFQKVSAINDKGKVEVTYVVNVPLAINDTILKEQSFIAKGFETKAHAARNMNSNLSLLLGNIKDDGLYIICRQTDMWI